MVRKVLFVTVLLMLIGSSTAFAAQIDSLASGSEILAPPTYVFVNPGGAGDALIYGYYNVRGYENYFTVINTDTTEGARVRIRFREAATLDDDCNGSYEVLDFDICLSPGDVWGGVIYTDSNGYARLESWDIDTYVLTGTGAGRFPEKYPSGLQFSTNLGNTADQTREGYFEIIAQVGLTEVPSGGNCGPNLIMNETDVGNSLIGHNYMISPITGATFAYNATALGDFALGVIGPYGVASDQPNFSSDSEDGTITPVNYALTKRYLATVYDVEPGAKTSLIVTFPTKWATHTCTDDDDDIFDDPRVKITVWDDQENSPTTTCDVSPCDPEIDTELPHEVNVIDLNNGGIFTSDVETLIATPYDFGWIGIDLADANTSTPSPAHEINYYGFVSIGLPAIGYVVHDFDNGASSGMLPLQYSSDVIAPELDFD